MSSDTPKTDDPETGYRAHYAEHEHNRELCRRIERDCIKQGRHAVDLFDRVKELERALAAMTARVEAAERDAERYRWVRKNWFEHQWPKPILRAADVETVDAAIDAAREGK